MKKLISLLLACMMLFAMTTAFADKISTVTDSYAIFAETAPTIDGVIDDMWADVPELWSYKEYTEDIGQAYGYTKIMWDEANLYFLAVIYDYTLDCIQPGNTANGVNFWVSETNSGAEGDFVLPGDWHIYANPFAEFNYYTGNMEAMDKGIAKATINLEADEPYYIVELKMPVLTPDLKLAEGAFIGYDVSVDDDADGDGARDCYAAGYYYGTYWSAPAALGNIQLVKAVPAE